MEGLKPFGWLNHVPEGAKAPDVFPLPPAFSATANTLLFFFFFYVRGAPIFATGRHSIIIIIYREKNANGRKRFAGNAMTTQSENFFAA